MASASSATLYQTSIVESGHYILMFFYLLKGFLPLPEH